MKSSLARTSQFRWSPDAVRRLDDEVEWAFTSNPTGPAEVAGVLLGTLGPIVEITDCYPVIVMDPRDHIPALTESRRRAFERAIAAFHSTTHSGLSVVGFYSSRIGSGFQLSQEDLELIRTSLPHTSRIALLVNVAGSAARNIKLFAGEDGQLLKEFHCSSDTSVMPRWLELWHHLSGESEEESPRPDEAIEPEERETSETAPVSVTEDPTGAPLSRHLPLKQGLSYVLAGTFILCLLVGFLIFRGSAGSKERAEVPGVAAQKTPREGGYDSELALRARRDGDDLRLDWNRAAPQLAAASGGILTVREGNAEEKNVTLDGELLRIGTIVYRPVHGNVVLRLVIFGQGGAKLGESVATYPQEVSQLGQ